MPPDDLKKIGKYDVLGVIGQGGMGVVYKGVDSRIGRSVAIKMLTSGFSRDSDALRRFYREAQSVGVLQHPNIVIVYDLGDEDGTPYLVMEYLDGEPVDRIIASHAELPIFEKLGIVIQVLRALHYAHQHRIVHRDVKPANVIVLQDGNCKLVDFGIARGGDTTLTRPGQVIGTMRYMSPEQLNDREIDARTDIWSAAVTLYELLTFHLPFEARDTGPMFKKILSEPAPPLSAYLANYPPELDEIIARALAKEREERYQTADDFAFDLSHVQELLKAQMVSDYVEQARSSVQRSELSRARDLLSRVLKVDTQNSTAKQLLYEVQQLMQRAQRGEQVRQLCTKAEDALKSAQFDDALSLVDQALRIDKANLDLLGLREAIMQRKNCKEQVGKLLHLAEAAQKAGELQMAARALDDARALDPNDTQVTVLASKLARDIEQHQRFEALLGSVRGEIAGRRFTAAIELIQQAEAINPSAPELVPLKNVVIAGRHEQQRQQRLAKFRAEVEQLLSREEFLQAQSKIEEALRSFPGDHSLIELLEKAKAAQQSRWVEQQLLAAERLAAEGRFTAAITLMETAAAQFPSELRVVKEIPVLRQRAEQRRIGMARERAISDATDALQRGDHPGAISLVERAQVELGHTPEFDDLLSRARAAAAEAARTKQIQEIVQGAQGLLEQGNLEEAGASLDSAIASGVKDDAILRLRDYARAQALEFKVGVEQAIGKASELLAGNKAEDAVSLLEAQPPSYVRSVDFRLLRDRARAEANRQHAIRDILKEARSTLRARDVDRAWEIVQGCRARYGENPDIAAVLAQIDAERARVAREAAERAAAEARNQQVAEVIERARKQIEAGELEPAIAYLTNVAARLKDPRILQLLADAQTQQEQFRSGVETAVRKGRELLDAHKPAEAISFLEAQPDLYRHAPALRALLEHSRIEFQQKQAAAAEQQRRIVEVVQQAQTLLRQSEFEKAEALLASAEAWQDDSIRRLREDLRHQQKEFERAVQAMVRKGRALLDKGKPDEAVALLTAQPAAYSRVEAFRSALEAAQANNEQRRALEDAVDHVRAVVNRGDLDAAAAELESCRARFGDVPELAKLAADVQKERKRQARVVAQAPPKPPSVEEPASATVMISGAAAQAVRAPIQQPGLSAPPVAAVAPAPVSPGTAKGPISSRWIAAAAMVAVVVAAIVYFAWPAGTLVKFTSNLSPTDIAVNGQHHAAPWPVKLKPGNYEVTATHDKQQIRRPITVSATPQEFALDFPTTQIASPPPPAPAATGHLTIQSTLDGVNITVDDQPRGQLKARKPLDLELAVGAHPVRADKDGYKPFEKTVEIAEGKRIELPVPSLEKMAKDESYLVITSIPNATIRVDKETAIVPANGIYSKNVVPGNHRVEVIAPDHNPWNASITTRPGETKQMSAIPDVAKVASPPPPPTPAKLAIIDFTVTPEEIEQGHSAELHWQTQNATEVTIDNGVGKVEGGGKTQVTPGITTTYTLTAKASGQPSQTRMATVNVKLPPPRPVAPPIIKVFRAKPNKLKPGEQTELMWMTDNTTEVSIDNGIGRVESFGTRDLAANDTTTYTLTAKNARSSVTATAPVTVIKGPTPEEEVLNFIQKDFIRAYQTLSVAKLGEVWMLTKDQKDVLQDEFKKYRGIQFEEDCRQPVVTGESARCQCMEAISYTDSTGKVTARRPVAVVFELIKSSGRWKVRSHTGAK